MLITKLPFGHRLEFLKDGKILGSISCPNYRGKTTICLDFKNEIQVVVTRKKDSCEKEETESLRPQG